MSDSTPIGDNTPVGENIRVIENATCTFCGCVCDDQILTVDLDQKRITKVKNTCVLGRAWFTEHALEVEQHVAQLQRHDLALQLAQIGVAHGSTMTRPTRSRPAAKEPRRRDRTSPEQRNLGTNQ